MRFTAFNDMVDFLETSGVDTDFDNREKWIKTPRQLFDEHLKGEVRFGQCPGADHIAVWSDRVRIQILTLDEVLLEIYREYPTGKRVYQFDETTACPVRLLEYSGWSASETKRQDETDEETIARLFEQEFGLTLQPGNLPTAMRPISHRYSRVSERLSDHQGFHDVGKDPLYDPPRRSTVYPLWSIVCSHWWSWEIPTRPVESGFTRKDEDVLICREWRPR